MGHASGHVSTPDAKSKSDRSKDLSSLSGINLLSIKDLTKVQIEGLVDESKKMLLALEKHNRIESLKGMIMATLFYEPSTRTRLSFESAMQRLGGGVIGFEDPGSSSAMKGESLADTVKVVSAYADVIVLRHPKEGAAAEAARHSTVPVINAGDGPRQHPTQALLDLFTIKMQKNRIENLKVAMVGDLKNGRTVHSLAYALAMFDNRITFIAPEPLQAPRDLVEDLNKNYNCSIEKSGSLDAALDADVVYMTRIQKERFPSDEEYRCFANSYTIDNGFLAKAKKDVIVMHPLPRLTEISPEIDGLKNSVYFQQAAYGVPVRMAILSAILGKT